MSEKDINAWRKATQNQSDTFDWDKWWVTSQKWGFNNLGVVQTLSDVGMELKMAIPGVNKEDIDITLIENAIEVECKIKNEFLEPFKHSFSILSYNIDSLDYSLVNGVLTIKLEKKEEFKPKKLEL